MNERPEHAPAPAPAPASARPTPTEELAAIVGRAGEMGIAPWRVATALEISPQELAAIEARLRAGRSA